MNESIVKITGEEDLYYDSNTKQYKSKMHCPYCGKYSGCWCYPDFESVPMWEDEYPNVYCSDRCFVLDEDEICKEIAAEMGITIKPTMEEWNASKIVKVFMEDFVGDMGVSGGSCET